MGIWVTNETDKAFSGRYAGVNYYFAIGTPVELSSEAATHIFGFGHEDKSASLRRLGWLITSDQEEAALARLTQVKFGAAPPSSEADADLSGNAGPLVNAGGVEGDGEAQADPSPKTTRLKKGSEKVV